MDADAIQLDGRHCRWNGIRMPLLVFSIIDGEPVRTWMAQCGGCPTKPRARGILHVWLGLQAPPFAIELRSDRYPVETQLHGAAEEGGET